MTRIRVNTDDLKNKAKDFESAAEAFARAGDDIAAAAMAMPSYDGQLSGPARKAGYEIQSQAREMKTALTNDALYLQKAAQDFERVNDQAVDALNQNQEMLMAAGSLDGGFNPARSSGTSYLGYNYDPSNPDVIILCLYGVCKKVIITDENRAAINDFILQVDGGTYTNPETGIKVEIQGYYDAKTKYDAAEITAIGASTGLIALGIVACLTVVAAPAAVAAVTSVAAANAAAVYVQQQAQADMTRATTNAADDWNKIIVGENQVGDPSYNITDQGPGANKPVYEPPETPISSETPEPVQ
jgi:hypothetical protein